MKALLEDFPVAVKKNTATKHLSKIEQMIANGAIVSQRDPSKLDMRCAENRAAVLKDPSLRITGEPDLRRLENREDLQSRRTSIHFANLDMD